MEDCGHDWRMFPCETGREEPNCRVCHDIPAAAEQKWYRQCRLCGRLESFTLRDGQWEHREETEGIPI